MTEQAKVPAIRFAGFTDPWEQRKLGELVVIERGGSPRPIDEYITDDTNGLNWVKIGDAPSLGRYISKTSEKIKPEGLSKTRQVHPGDLILSNSMSFGRPYIMAIEGCIHDGWLLIRDEPKSFDPMYLCHMLGTPKMLNQYRMLASGSTVNNLNKELVSNASILMPCKSEQKVIGQFFNHLDDLITLHQRKYDKLVIFKKSMLEKMFPKDGESVPEIRFAGFTDPWEQRKLGELEKDATLYMGRGRVISTKDMSNTPGTFPVYSSSALDNGRMGAYGKYMFNQELITWSIDGGGAVFYRRKHRFSVTNVSGYIAVNPEKISCKFLAYAMSLAHSRIKFDYTVKAHPSVIRSLYTMGIPISLQEQQVIGSFFSRLDDLITLHQRKLELLQNIKKSLLDKMFV